MNLTSSRTVARLALMAAAVPVVALGLAGAPQASAAEVTARTPVIELAPKHQTILPAVVCPDSYPYVADRDRPHGHGIDVQMSDTSAIAWHFTGYVMTEEGGVRYATGMPGSVAVNTSEVTQTVQVLLTCTDQASDAARAR